MKDINLVLRNKRVQLAELALEVDGLEAAATALRPVVHLLSEDGLGHDVRTHDGRAHEDPPQSVPAARISISPEAQVGAVSEEARAAAPERSRVRRWV